MSFRGPMDNKAHLVPATKVEQILGPNYSYLVKSPTCSSFSEILTWGRIPIHVNSLESENCMQKENGKQIHRYYLLERQLRSPYDSTVSPSHIHTLLPSRIDISMLLPWQSALSRAGIWDSPLFFEIYTKAVYLLKPSRGFATTANTNSRQPMSENSALYLKYPTPRALLSEITLEER